MPSTHASWPRAGHAVEIIDKRDHIAGNCYDYVHQSGVRVHRYGPHLFHTSNMRVVEWLSRFTQWLPYEHRVKARLPDGRCVPMPVNLDTVNAVFGTALETPEQVAAALAARAVPREAIVSAEDHLYATIGRELTDLFFRPYTKKMWAMDLSETAAAVVQRLQIRTDRDDRYFPNDSFQAMPAQGYTRLFERMLDHPGIEVRLQTAFERGMGARLSRLLQLHADRRIFRLRARRATVSLDPLPPRGVSAQAGAALCDAELHG